MIENGSDEVRGSERGTEFAVFDLAGDPEGKFSHLLSRRALAALERAGSFGVGVAVAQEQGLIPAGALVCTADPSMDPEAPFTAELFWLYVDEEYRGRGAGGSLMEFLYDVLEEAGVGGVVCDVPLDGACDGLVRFLSSWGFLFRPVEKNEFILSPQELAQSPISDWTPDAAHVSSIGRLPPDMLTEALGAVHQREWLSLSPKEFDPDLSCIHFDGMRPDGIFLVRRSPLGMVEPLLLRGAKGSGAGSPVVRDLLSFSVHRLLKLMKGMFYVDVTIRSREGAELWDALFPEIPPILIRRGVCIPEEVEDGTAG